MAKRISLIGKTDDEIIQLLENNHGVIRIKKNAACISIRDTLVRIQEVHRDTISITEASSKRIKEIKDCFVYANRVVNIFNIDKAFGIQFPSKYRFKTEAEFEKEFGRDEKYKGIKYPHPNWNPEMDIFFGKELTEAEEDNLRFHDIFYFIKTFTKEEEMENIINMNTTDFDVEIQGKNFNYAGWMFTHNELYVE